MPPRSWLAAGVLFLLLNALLGACAPRSAAPNTDPLSTPGVEITPVEVSSTATAATPNPTPDETQKKAILQTYSAFLFIQMNAHALDLVLGGIEAGSIYGNEALFKLLAVQGLYQQLDQVLETFTPDALAAAYWEELVAAHQETSQALQEWTSEQMELEEIGQVNRASLERLDELKAAFESDLMSAYGFTLEELSDHAGLVQAAIDQSLVMPQP